MLYLPFTRSLIEPFKLYLSTLSGSSNWVSDAAWNLWHFFYSTNTSDSVKLLGISVRIWSVSLLIISLVFIIKRLWQKFSTNNVYQMLFLFSFLAFFIQTRVHERHLFPALVFLLLIKGKRQLLSYLALSGYHLLNLYLVLGLPFV